MPHPPTPAGWRQAGWAARHFATRHHTSLLTGGAVAVIAFAVLTPVAVLTAPGALVDTPTWLGPVLRHELARSAAAVRLDGLAELAIMLRAAAVLLAVLAGAALIGIALARAARQAEAVAIHRAVGASRHTLRRAAVVEAACVAGLTALLGAGVALFALRLGVAAWPGRVNDVPLTWLGIALVVTPLVAVALGSLLPLLATRSRRVEPNTGPPLELHLAGGLLGVGAAAIAAAVLLAPALSRRDTESAWITHLRLPNDALADPARLAELIDTVAPSGGGIGLAGAGTELGLGAVEQHVTDCGACSLGGMPTRYRYPTVVDFAVSPDTFGAIGARLIAGRLLQPTDRATTEPVVVINRRMATDNFESVGAVGRLLQLSDLPDRWYRVVGVVDDQNPTGFGTGLLPPARAYFALPQRPVSHLSVIAPGTAATARAASAPSPAQVIDHLSLAELRSRETALLRWNRGWLFLLGAAATLVAILASGTLVATWLRGERAAVGIQRGVGARRRRLALELGVRLLHLAVVATVTTIVAASGFRTQLSHVVPGSAPWRIGSGLAVLGSVLLVAVLVSVRPSRPLFRWTPARLLGE
jgi:hypothetical protein